MAEESYEDRERRRKREWARNNRDKVAASTLRWRQNNPEKYQAYQREWHQKHAERLRQVTRKWTAANPERARAAKLKNHAETKEKVFSHYSPAGIRCACCGETELKFLSIDHIEGGGNKHRKAIGRGAGGTFYRWIIKEGYPPGYQVLCYNCNLAKGFFGRCPHQDAKK